MTTPAHEKATDAKAEPKKAKAGGEPDFQAEIQKIATGIKTLTDAGVGGAAAAEIGYKVWDATCCE